MVLVLGIVAALLYRLLMIESRIPENLRGTSPSKTESISPRDDMGQSEVVDNQIIIPQFTPSELDSILQLLQPHKFHEDAYVEIKMLFGLKSSCKYRKTTKLPCDEINSRFIKLEKFIKAYQDLQHIPTSTELGEALKQGWSYDPQQPALYRKNIQNLLRKLIESNNPLVLSHYSTNFIYDGVDKGEILPFTEWLNSQDQDYNGLVLMYALLKMAAQLESNNQEDSNALASFMFCTIDESLCELGFAEGYKLLVMPGMQKDVDLMVTHLQTFALEP
ncbi:MAG: hypothetical protein R3E90_08460 [Marinicella sp.]